MNNNNEGVEPTEPCPNCGSEDVEYIVTNNKLFDITTDWYYDWFLGHFVCNSCDEIWITEEDC